MSSQTHLKLVTKLSFLRNLNFLSILFNYLFFKMWNASQFCVSSLLRGKHDANLPCNVPILVNVLPKQDKKPSFLCHPSYTDQIFSRPIFESFTDKIRSQKFHNFPASFANFLQWLHLNNLFYKTSMLTPFVKPCQVLSYLDVALGKSVKLWHYRNHIFSRNGPWATVAKVFCQCN